MVNRVLLVEDFVYRVERESYQPSEEEVKYIGEILGQPTKKLNVVLERYQQVFSKYIEKKCSEVGSQLVCIYSWRANTPFRAFPLALHALGTILLFEDEKPVKVLAYPFNKPLSYAKSPGVPESEYGLLTPREVSLRVDGWHLTAYYNPVLGRWVFATKYALHNMYYKKGKLVVEEFNNIVNPYVSVADTIAENEGLYSALDRYRGWTFTFVLEGPEPAITHPPPPIGVDVEKFKLHLLMSRSPEGRLYTWSETQSLLNYRTPLLLEPKPLRELYKEVKQRLDVRSYFAYVDTGDPENPLIVELESDYYAEAMNTKYLNSAKSAALLISEGVAHELTKLLDKVVAERVRELEKAYYDLESVLANALRAGLVKEASEALLRALRDLGVKGLQVTEVTKNLGEGNIKRVLRKVLASLLEDKSLLADETLELVHRLVNALRELQHSL